MSKALVITLLAFIYSTLLFGQKPSEADELFAKGNFEAASAMYQEQLDSAYNGSVAYKLAVCYLNTFFDKTRAVPILEKLKTDAHPDPNTLYMLGRAYHFSGEYEKAIQVYSEFIKTEKGTPDNLEDAGKEIEYCENAREYVKYPVNVEIKNIGQKVNSLSSDYFPFVSGDESFILFNSKRNDGSFFRTDGSFHSNIYMSKVENGEFQRSELLPGKINDPMVSEEIVGMTQKGDKALVYIDDEQKKTELRLLLIENGQVTKSEKLPKQINSRFHEIAACLNGDGTEIYFASDRPGGYGGIDIYVIRKLGNGKWGNPQNLGPAVNTAYDEDFPNIAHDGKSLYFSSKGHASMGGYDIFVAQWDEEKVRFMRARNLGYPINTAGDDMNFRVSQSGRYGYISYAIGQGLGDWDIYRVTFLDVEPEVTVINGKLKLPEDFSWKSIAITVLNDGGDTIGEYLPNLNTLRYVMALTPGKYHLHVDVAGLEKYKEVIYVMDKVSYQPLIEKDIELK
ncbi:MAG: tetratricopeptide repeat protein [Flavobacteriales bacterium]